MGSVRWLVVEENVIDEEINMSYFQTQHTVQHNLLFYCKINVPPPIKKLHVLDLKGSSSGYLHEYVGRGFNAVNTFSFFIFWHEVSYLTLLLLLI